jgi:hypothetical protein
MPQAATGTPAFNISAGTIITIRMIGAIDTSVNQSGQRFDASVDLPVLAYGKVAIPRGAPARVLLADIGQASGRTNVALELVHLTFGGFNYPVHSYLFEQKGISRKRAAAIIGGTAAAGAAVGGVFGGGQGAAAGAGAGAAAGSGAAIAARNGAIVIPAETRISFTLRTPIHVLR